MGVQWLRFHAPKAEGQSFIPGEGTRSHLLQLKIPHATTKMENPSGHVWDQTQLDQSIYIKKERKENLGLLIWGNDTLVEI